ncbi:MAG: metallophosphoesterase [Pseudomonadales bacterium]
MRDRLRRGFATQLLLVAALVLSASIASEAREAPRVVAIGDVHGAYEPLLRILGAAELVDGEGHWIGDRATLVQVGDLIDRGADDRKVLEFMMRLEREAKAAGGRVIALLGNHEVMNLHGDLRYVSVESFASFADPSSQRRLEAAYEKYLRLRWPADEQTGPETWKSFIAKRPAGFLEHREAFGRKGHIGRWLRQRRAVAKIGDVVFLHGGFHPELASFGVAKINARIKTELAIFDSARDYLVRRRRILPSADIEEVDAAARRELESARRISDRDRRDLELLGTYRNWVIAHPTGPLWFRGLAKWSDDELAARVPEVLEELDAKHIVIGHTAQLDGGIVSRLDGKVVLIDTGILGGAFYPGGVLQALEIIEGRFQIIDIRGARVAVVSKPEKET